MTARKAGALSHRARLDSRGQASGSLQEHQWINGNVRRWLLQRGALYTNGQAPRLGSELLNSAHVACLEGRRLLRAIGRSRARDRVSRRSLSPRPREHGSTGLEPRRRELRGRGVRQRARGRDDLYGAHVHAVERAARRRAARPRARLGRRDRPARLRRHELARDPRRRGDPRSARRRPGRHAADRRL